MILSRTPTDARAAARMAAMQDYRTYRRLLYRGYVLYARIALLQCVLWLVTPIATPLIIGTIRRWFEHVAADGRALNRAIRSLRERVAAGRAALPPPPVIAFENPWT